MALIVAASIGVALLAVWEETRVVAFDAESLAEGGGSEQDVTLVSGASPAAAEARSPSSGAAPSDAASGGTYFEAPSKEEVTDFGFTVGKVLLDFVPAIAMFLLRLAIPAVVSFFEELRRPLLRSAFFIRRAVLIFVLSFLAIVHIPLIFFCKKEKILILQK